MTIEFDDVVRAPKVLLHDHLDGGLRPTTLLELADASGYTELPADDPEALAAAMSAERAGDLPGYLGLFRHTVGVLQTPEALARAARECVEDLHADGVVYAEVRFAPMLHTQRGTSPEAAVEAVADGLATASADTGTEARLLLTAMRTASDSDRVADLAAAYRAAGVVGFDLAGAEAGHPASRHRTACDRVRDAGLHLTLHAGEADGAASIEDALSCGAQRLGHGMRIVDDIDADGRLGPLARRIHDERIPLELCPTSNIHTGAVTTFDRHPVDRLHGLGFAVTVNTDNRLMSQVSQSTELTACTIAFGWGWAQLYEVTRTAMRGAFCDDDTRQRLLDDVITPWYAALADQSR